MNIYVAMFVSAVFGFVLAQFLYTGMLNRGHDREQRLNDMLRASHRRYDELSQMLAEARQR